MAFFGSPFYPSVDPFFSGALVPFGHGYPSFAASFPPAFPPAFPGLAGFPPAGSPGSPAPGPDGLVPHQDGEANVPTLTYFGTYGLAQAIRLVFVEAGVHFHEREMDNKEDWTALKAQLPFAQLPVLEIDGQVIAQSNAILRYVGRKYNLVGRTPAEQAQVDTIIEGVKDAFAAFPVRSVFQAIAAGEDPVSSVESAIPEVDKHLQKFERFLEAKLQGQQLPEDAPLFFVGNSLTIADISVYATLHLIATFSADHGVFEKLPLLQRALDSTYHRPNIQTFLDGERAFPVVPSQEKIKELFAVLS